MNITINPAIAFRAGEGKTFKPDWVKVSEQMNSEGLVHDLSRENTAKIDHEFAMDLKKIRNDFFRKSDASLNAVKNIIVR